MNTNRKSTSSPEGQRQLVTFRQTVDKTLEKKRRRGQYAVTCKDDKPVVSDEDAPGTGEIVHCRVSL